MDNFTASSQNELILLPPQLLYSKRHDSSESDEERNLNDFQRKMRREHLRALAHINKACVFTERIRRKRITVSCNKLRELLPKVQGTRSDMVTVLEMTIAFLENIQEFAKGHQYREILYPPEQLYCRWLLETHLRKQQCQKKSCEEEQERNCQQQKSGASKGMPLSPIPGQELPSEGQRISTPAVPSVSADLSLDRFAAPSFWSPAALMSPVNPASQTFQATSWDNCTTPVGLRIGCYEDCASRSHCS